jgi:hypothetical protein
MAANVERRLEALEALEAREGPALRWVWKDQCETADEAKQRAGVQPGERVIVFSWQDLEL